MIESRFDKPEIDRFAALLWASQSLDDILKADRVLGVDAYGIHSTVALPTYEANSRVRPLLPHPALMQRSVVPYFCYPYVYHVRHEPLFLPPLKPDYTITFDSNFAGCVDRLVRGLSLHNLPNEFMPTVDAILRNDLNFDSSFYLAENIKQAQLAAQTPGNRQAASPDQFWSLLQSNFRQNIVSLELFRNADCQLYARTGELRFKSSIQEATDKCIKFTHWFYAGEGRDLAEELVFQQKAILFQLLVALRIQFESSTGPKEKLLQFIAYVHEKAVYFDREAIIAHKYFKDRRAVPILGAVNKGGSQRNLFEKLDNLAWDMTSPRYMETMMRLWADDSFLVPFFVSLDPDLRDMIQCYPVKAVVVDRSSRGLRPIPKSSTYEYFRAAGCETVARLYFCDDKRRERRNKGAPTFEILSNMITEEQARLGEVLAQGS